MTKKTVSDILFILIATTICHLLFSKYGFNPTDEGFVLSSTNRVLHGQIPHVDFSSVRPLGYAYLHIPELLISKTHFFLVSRFVFWLEQILIAFLWVRFLEKAMKQHLPLFFKYSTVLICFIFNVHYFPCSVLHTIDGLLMCMIGINLIILEKKWHFIGFFFIGFAALCKQNYLVVLPFALFLFGRKNIVVNILVGLLPIFVYVFFISINGGWYDLTTQLSGHNELIQVGIITYLKNPVLLAIVIYLIIIRYNKWKYDFTHFILYIVCIVALATNHYHGKLSFIFFSIVLAELIIGISINKNLFIFKDYSFNDEKLYNAGILQEEDFTIAIVVLLISWCTSISVGYNTPVLFSGACICFINLKFSKHDIHKKISAVGYMFIVFIIILFYYIRTHTIYRDLEAAKLSYKLDNIVEGATGIYTNKNTYDVLIELDSLKKSIPNLIVVPDFTACNILHSHESKILTEWPNKTEIPNNKILEKVTSKINIEDATLVFAIPKYQTALLKDGFTVQENRGLNYPIIKFVKTNYTKKSFSKYFELRKK